MVVGRQPSWARAWALTVWAMARENLRPITLSISNGAFPRLMSTRALSTYTQSTRTHAEQQREAEAGAEEEGVRVEQRQINNSVESTLRSLLRAGQGRAGQRERGVGAAANCFLNSP